MKRRSLADDQQYEYSEDLGVTAVALYDYQAGEDATFRWTHGQQTSRFIVVASMLLLPDPHLEIVTQL